MILNKRLINDLLPFVKYLKPYSLKLFLIYFLSLILSGINILQPLVIMTIIDLFKRGTNIKILCLLLFIQIILSFYVIFFQYIEQLLTQYCNGLIILDIKTDLVNHIHKLPINYFTKESPANLLNRVNNDAGAFAIFINGTFKRIITNIITIVGVLTIARFIGNEYIFIAIASTGIFYFITFKYSKKQRELEKSNSAARGIVYNTLMESLNGIDVVKAYLTEKLETEKFYAASLKQISLNFLSLQIRFKKTTINEIIESAVLATIYGIGGYQVIAGSITIGGLIAIHQYTQQLRNGLSAFGLQYEGMAIALGQIERVIEIFKILPEELDSENKIVLHQPLNGSISFENVSSSYEKNSKIIDCANINIRQGEKVLFTGPSGIGKTTIIKLLLRYIKPSQGNIFVDGYNIQTINLESYRSNFGIILQEMKFFSGSIRDNILYGIENITEDEIISATKTAQIHDFIMTLPKGYETLISANFTQLSGGQKQRIFLARAILKKPSIYIFDEATSSLDMETYLLIREALKKVIKNKTCIIISHDQHIINYVDKVYMINKGKVFRMEKSLIEKL